MSILNNTTDTTPIALQRSATNFARGVVRVINNFVAAVIAQRERQANLTILRSLSDRELRDMGLARSQIAGGLVEAAKERAGLKAAGGAYSQPVKCARRAESHGRSRTGERSNDSAD